MGHGSSTTRPELADATRMQDVMEYYAGETAPCPLMRSDGVCIIALRPQQMHARPNSAFGLEIAGCTPQIQVSVDRIDPVLGNIPIERPRVFSTLFSLFLAPLL